MNVEPSAAPARKGLAGRLLRTLVSLGLFALVLLQVDLGEFWRALRGFTPLLLLGLPLVFGLNVLLSTWKWSVLLQNLGLRERFGRLFLIYFISFFWGNFLPSTIGGDGYRFLTMRARHPGRDREIFSSILQDRLYGYGVLLGLHILLAGIFFPAIFASPLLLWTEAAILAAGLLALLAWTQRRLLARLRLDRWQVVQSVLDKIGRVLQTLERQTLQTVTVGVLTSLLFALISGWVWGIYYTAAGASFDWLFVQYASTLSSIIGTLPISINGIGLVELTQTVAMAAQGVTAERVLIAALSARVMALLIAALGGLAYLLDTWLARRSAA